MLIKFYRSMESGKFVIYLNNHLLFMAHQCQKKNGQKGLLGIGHVSYPYLHCADICRCIFGKKP